MESGTDFTCKGSCCACYSFFYNISDIYIEGDVPVWDATFQGFLNLEINWNIFTGYRYDFTTLTPVAPTITKYFATKKPQNANINVFLGFFAGEYNLYNE